MIVNFPFAAYIFHNDSNFWKWRHFDLVRNLMGKAIINGNWKLSNGNFWLKLNMLLLCLQKTSKFETFLQSNCFIFIVKALERLWSYVKCENIENGMRLGQVARQLLCLKTIVCKIFFEKIKNQPKLAKNRKIYYLLLRNSEALWWNIHFWREDWTLHCVPT